MQYRHQLMIAPQCKFVEACFKCFKRLKISGILSMTLHTSQHTSMSWYDQFSFCWKVLIIYRPVHQSCVDIIQIHALLRAAWKFRVVVCPRVAWIIVVNFSKQREGVPLKFWHLGTRLWSIPSSQAIANYSENVTLKFPHQMEASGIFKITVGNTI